MPLLEQSINTIFWFVELIYKFDNILYMKWWKLNHVFYSGFTDPSEKVTFCRVKLYATDLLELHQLPKSTQPDPPLSSPSIYVKLQHYLPFLFNNEVC